MEYGLWQLKGDNIGLRFRLVGIRGPCYRQIIEYKYAFVLISTIMAVIHRFYLVRAQLALSYHDMGGSRPCTPCFCFFL